MKSFLREGVCALVATLAVGATFGEASCIVALVFFLVSCGMHGLFHAVEIICLQEKNTKKHDDHGENQTSDPPILWTKSSNEGQEGAFAMNRAKRIIVTKHGKCWHSSQDCRHLKRLPFHDDGQENRINNKLHFLNPCKHCVSGLGAWDYIFKVAGQVAKMGNIMDSDGLASGRIKGWKRQASNSLQLLVTKSWNYFWTGRALLKSFLPWSSIIIIIIIINRFNQKGSGLLLLELLLWCSSLFSLSFALSLSRLSLSCGLLLLFQCQNNWPV